MLKEDYYRPPTEMDLLIFEKLVPTDHYLRQVKAVIDFNPLRSLVTDCYSKDQGRPADDPAMMFKILFLEFHYDLSDRDVLKEAQVNIAFRFFLDLSMESLLPSPGLLSQFRKRLGAELFKQSFNEILRQARERGLVKDRLRLKDATHVIADIAIPSTIQLVAQTRERLLKAARGFAPDEVTAHLSRAAEIRQSTADLKNEQRLLARIEHLREIIQWADQWSASLGQAASGGAPLIGKPEQESFNQALEVAHKVLNDRAEKATDKLVSHTDTDARNGMHCGYFTGYICDVSIDADSELICALDVLPGNGDEGGDAKALIEAEEAAHGNDIESLSIDSAGFRGEVLRELSMDESGPQLTVYVPPYKWPHQEAGLFKSEDFNLNETGDELRCPAGHTTSNRTRASHNQGWQFRFAKSKCEQCPMRSRCLKPEIKNGRNVIKHDYEAEFRAARERAQTEEFKEVRRQHPAIERKLSEIIRRHGGRRVRYRGRLRVKIQYFVTAIVVNFKRIVKLLNPTLHPQPA